MQVRLRVDAHTAGQLSQLFMLMQIFTERELERSYIKSYFQFSVNKVQSTSLAELLFPTRLA